MLGIHPPAILQNPMQRSIQMNFRVWLHVLKA